MTALTKFGSESKVVFLYGPETHKLHLEFQVNARKQHVTLSADLVTSNVFHCEINGVAITDTTFGTDHDATMAAIATKIAAHADVDTCTKSGRVFTITPLDQTKNLIISAWITAGATQATITNGLLTYPIKAGAPVELSGSGELVVRHTTAASRYKVIGYAIKDGDYNDLITVVMRAYGVVMMKAAASIVPGPVEITKYATDHTPKVSNTSTAANVMGWCLDTETTEDDYVRVAII